MTELTPDDIANLRSIGFMVSSKEGQTFVESSEYVIEEDFGRWFLYHTGASGYDYVDEFAGVFDAIDYTKDLK